MSCKRNLHFLEGLLYVQEKLPLKIAARALQVNCHFVCARVLFLCIPTATILDQSSSL